ncbi:MAG: hypothetical protein FIB07_04340 [Candidatus Methanoperedens sp.]|nr:hypothetical protein [Candidatus Methanoperedens sp.]
MMKSRLNLIIAVLALILTADGALANKFVFTEGESQTLNVGVVSTKITIERQTDSGVPLTSPALYNIVLSSTSTGGKFYSNAAGTTQIYRINIANGASNASFYYRDTKGGVPALSVSLTGWTPAATTFTINPNKLVFTAGENQILDGGEVSSLITVQRQTSDGAPITSPALYNVILSSTSTGGRFYSNAAGTIQIYSINIANGASNASFYYRDTRSGNPTLRASITGWTSAATTFTINQNKLVFTEGTSQTLDGGEVSSLITVQRQTIDGTPITSPALYNIVLSSTSTSGKFYSNAAGTIQIYRINIANGASNASFYYKDTAAGTPTLKASLAGWTPASTQFTINQNKLVFTGGTNQTLNSGEVSSLITVQRQTLDGTPITSPALYNIVLSSTSAGGKFYSNAAGTIQIYRINIANGASNASFYYKDTAAGTPTLRASLAGWTPDNTVFTIGRDKLVFMAGVPQTLDTGELSFPITVQRQKSDGTPIIYPTLYNIQLSTSSAGGKFYSNAAGTTLINHIDILYGASTASFYYRDTVAGNPVLTISRTGWTSDTTPAFTINPAAAKKLAFLTQPVTTTAGLSITPAVEVEVQDAYGNRVTSSTASISIVMGLNPGGGVLTGGESVNAVDGIATFDSLSINKDGLGYTLKTSSPGLTGATSSLFNIIPVYTHSITNATGGIVNSVGGIARDTVSSSSISGTTMNFTWIRPNSSIAKKAISPRYMNNYTDTSLVDLDGTWTINTIEKKWGNIPIGNSSTTFSVIAAPEFGKFGALLPLIAAGLIFMNFRKKILRK